MDPADPALMSQSLQALAQDPEAMLQILDMFPMPVQVFRPDGLLIFSSRAFTKMNNISDPTLTVGCYNVLDDPVMEQMGIADGIRQAFAGQAVLYPGFEAPIDDLVQRGAVEERPFEKAVLDCHLFPVWDEDRVAYVVNVFIVKKLYQGHPDVVRAKAFIDEHWREKYDGAAVAQAAFLSTSQLYPLFKKHVGMSPGDYYKQVKIDHLKQALADQNLSITQAFTTCGETTHNRFARIFKDTTGMTPTEYRAGL